MNSKLARGSFSHDVMAAILVDQKRETAAVLVDQNNPQRIEFYFYANNSFCWPQVT